MSDADQPIDKKTEAMNKGEVPDSPEVLDNKKEVVQEDGSSADAEKREKSSDKNTAVLNDIYYIKTGKRLSHLDNGPVRAYEAYSQANKFMFAMICETHLPARFKDSEVYKKNTESSLVKLISSGTVFWSPDNMYKHAFVYEGTKEKPVLANARGAGMGMKPEKVMNSFVKPVINGLRNLRDLDLYHGHVRLDNIYAIKADNTLDNVVLGDGLSLPAGYTDNTIYLPPHKAMADPAARGLGNISDDLYALGICLAILLRSADPMEGMSEKDILQMKISQGSYMCMTNKDRFSGGVLELLRGLLQDDVSQRWTMDDVLAWMEGQRLTPKQGVKRNKAARAFVLGDQKYYYPENLAFGMHDYQGEAAKLIENDTLAQWLSRSVEDSKKVERLEDAVRTAREYGRTNFYHDRLICRTSIILDPKQPIRYRGYSLFPDGFGAAMAEAFKKRLDMNPFAHMINQHVIPFWLELQNETYVDIGELAMSFENCRNSLRQNKAGYGLERCLYILASECPCLSETYDKFVIRESQDFLVALDELAESKRMPKNIMDPHITAFLTVRDNRAIDPNIPDLSSSDNYRQILGTIKTLAAIQKKSDLKKLPALTNWASGYVKPFFDRYHDRDLKEEKIKDIQALKDKGDLKEFVNIMDDAKALQKDSIEFKKSIRDYYRLKLENYKFEKALSERDNYGQGSGREVAAIVSGFIASILILAITFMFFSGSDVIPR